MPTKEDEIGALWQRETKAGRPYFTGTVNGVDVVIFENTSTANPKAPQFRVYISRPRGE
jgi:uncharacterized protein (DUF736 family)